MAGSPLRRERREATEAAERASTRATGVPKRASRVDDATRRAGVARAAEVGAAQAAAELGVRPATIRSWRRKIDSEPPSPAAQPAQSAPAMPTEPAEITTVAELSEFARELMTSARASQKAIERAVREGKYTGSYHLSLATGIQLDKIAGLVAAVERLRETSGVSSDRELQRLTERLRGFLHEGNIDPNTEPWMALLARWFTGPMPTSTGVSVGAARALPEHAVGSVDGEAMPADDTGADDDDAEADGPLTDAEVVLDEPTAAGDAEPTTEPTGDAEQTDDEPLEMLPMSAVPLDFRNRFTLDAEGQERARVAWSEKVRDEKRATEAREQAAKAAAARPRVRAPSPPVSKLPAGWDRAPRGRGRGPSERAGG